MIDPPGPNKEVSLGHQIWPFANRQLLGWFSVWAKTIYHQNLVKLSSLRRRQEQQQRQ